MHGLPEEHNVFLFSWLDSFKRPKPTSPEYININSVNFIKKPVWKSFLLQLGLQDEVKAAAKIHPEEEHTVDLGLHTICCAQFVVSKQAIRLRSRDFWSNIQKLFHHESFRLVVEQTAIHMARAEQPSTGVQMTSTNGANATGIQDAEFIDQQSKESGAGNLSTKATATGDTRSSRPSVPNGHFPIDGTELQRPSINSDLMSYGTVDQEGSFAFAAFESVWHVLFGRPARDQPVLTRNSDSQDYWCKWFNNQTNSPCRIQQRLRHSSFDQCFSWAARSPVCDVSGKRKKPLKHYRFKEGFPNDMSKEYLLKEGFCCGTR